MNEMIYFWLAATLMTGLTVVILLLPLFRKAAHTEDTGAQGAKQVLLDQLEEIERDKVNGTIGKEEAEAARAELARRLLRLEKEAIEAGSASSVWGTNFARVFAALFVPALTIGGYLLLGVPNMPDQPISARLETPTEAQDVALLVARVEKHLEENPNDARGWLTIAPVYRRLGEMQKAGIAYQRALSIGGHDEPTEHRLKVELAEVITFASGGQISNEAFALFSEVAKADPKNAQARFYEALGLSQRKTDEVSTNSAKQAWKSLIDELGDGNPPWLEIAKRELASLDDTQQTEQAEADRPVASSGPTVEDIEAASNLSGEERMAMIEGMVAGLAERLQEQPDDPAGWERLIRSYIVLNKRDNAQHAVNQAREILAESGETRAVIDNLASELGLN